MAPASVACVRSSLIIVLFLTSFGNAIAKENAALFNIGAGIADITGPAAEVDMMGYANPAQTSHGLHIRQYSRAFIISNRGFEGRVAFVSIDACMVSQGVKLEVLKKLKQTYGNLYTEKNLCISGIHTHSGPGGFHQYLLFDITSLGFVRQTFDALVAGIVKSIAIAHGSMRPGNIYMNSGELLDSNINRSPTAYLNNPADEKAKYTHNVDKNMTVVKFVDDNGQGIGMISWYAVHCTSMNNTNQLISGDNKGYASMLFEAAMNKGAPPGKGKFVAAFAQSNEGDVSPNTMGPHCLDTGKPCDTNTSTCGGRNEMCVAFGPGKDMFDSTKIIGENQFKKAMELYNSTGTVISGNVDFRHSYVDMTNVTVMLTNSTTKTCKSAMGFSFAAGTTDGPGMFDFTQGTTQDNPLWDLIRNFLHKPSPEQVTCHHPKPILLDTGEMTMPYAWQPSIVDVQLLKIGQLVIIAVPAEFTTMSGRRTRDAVSSVLQAGGLAGAMTVIAGLSNDYADYVATFEEYQVQRYEGASTIYGPHTLDAYIQLFSGLAKALTKGNPVAAGPAPPNLLDKQLSFLPPVVFDNTPFRKKFGDVVKEAEASYKQGSTVTVVFVSADPRNNIRLDDTFLSIEVLGTDQKWSVVYTDSAWETIFQWKRTSTLLAESEATVIWNIPANQPVGTYRIRHFGSSKTITGTITDFTGATKEFKVVASSKHKFKNLKKIIKNKSFNRYDKNGHY